MRFVQPGRAVFAEGVTEGKFASAPYATVALPFFKALARAVQLHKQTSFDRSSAHAGGVG